MKMSEWENVLKGMDKIARLYKEDSKKHTDLDQKIAFQRKGTKIESARFELLKLRLEFEDICKGLKPEMPEYFVIKKIEHGIIDDQRH